MFYIIQLYLKQECMILVLNVHILVLNVHILVLNVHILVLNVHIYGPWKMEFNYSNPSYSFNFMSLCISCIDETIIFLKKVYNNVSIRLKNS